MESHTKKVWRVLLFLTLYFIVNVIAQSSTGSSYFINPSPPGNLGDYTQNNIYTIGQELVLQWNATYSTISLAISQDLAGGNTGKWIAQSLPPTQTYNWTVKVPEGVNLTELPGMLSFSSILEEIFQ